MHEIGYMPVLPGGGNLFPTWATPLRTRRHDPTPKRGFAEWGDLFGHPVVATTLLDRLPLPWVFSSIC
jgi:hypothetical protein